MCTEIADKTKKIHRLPPVGFRIVDRHADSSVDTSASGDGRANRNTGTGRGVVTPAPRLRVNAPVYDGSRIPRKTGTGLTTGLNGPKRAESDRAAQVPPARVGCVP